LKREFGRSLSDEGVQVLDPFTGTGNFIVRTMREIKKSALPQKFGTELHCNEVMLLPYYIASQNIEHAFYELTGQYQPFENLCLVDTFQLAEGPQMSMAFMTAANTERVERQKQAPIFVIIGNPPYNAHQLNENDNSKNRKYAVMDKRVAETYARDSAATNKNALSDPYVKAFRWASDRIAQTGEGIVAYVINNSFITDNLYNGMRKHLQSDFSAIYHVNLKGNARTTEEQRRREGGNVFDDAIRVSVGITFLVKKKNQTEPAKIYISTVDDYLRGDAKKEFLVMAEHILNLPNEPMVSNEKYNWLTADLINDFDTLMPMGTQEAKGGAGEGVIFKTFSNGVKTNRDAWAYNFNQGELARNIGGMVEIYNDHVGRWQRLSPKPNMDDFVLNDDTKISWSRDLKLDVARGKFVTFSQTSIRKVIYRPFTAQYLYFDRVMNEEVYQVGRLFPTIASEAENRVICVTNHSQIPFSAIMSANITEVAVGGRTGQVFPFYVYDEDGGNRRENISDWAVAQFNEHYGVRANRPGITVESSGKDGGHNEVMSGLDGSPLHAAEIPNGHSITKWDIFHYVYALLHSPAYREKYAANLKRDLPHIPFVETVDLFWKYVEAGKKLAELHVNYERQAEYPLEMVENAEARLDWRVEKMKLIKPTPLASGHPPIFDEPQSKMGGAEAFRGRFL
jgi:predicted helicase